MDELALDHYWIVARNKPALLVAMMKYLAGDAHISFEGTLSGFSFPATLTPSSEETAALRRSTLHPRLDSAVLKLTEETIRPILRVVLPENRFMKEVIHIQIEKGGRLQFGSDDNFHRDCIVCWLGVSTAFLDQLKLQRVIRSWTVP